MKKTALVVDDHSLFRDGMSTLLKAELGFAAIVEAATLAEADACLTTCGDIELALFDLAMPGVHEPRSLASLRARHPDLKIVIVTASEQKADVLSAIALGLNGLIPKSLPTGDLIAALHTIMAGQIYVPRLMLAGEPELAQVYKGQVSSADAPPPDRRASVMELTARQREVLECVCAGLSNREISGKLGISVNTVKIHISALLVAFGAQSRIQLLDICNEQKPRRS